MQSRTSEMINRSLMLKWRGVTISPRFVPNPLTMVWVEFLSLMQALARINAQGMGVLHPVVNRFGRGLQGTERSTGGVYLELNVTLR